MLVFPMSFVWCSGLEGAPLLAAQHKDADREGDDAIIRACDE